MSFLTYSELIIYSKFRGPVQLVAPSLFFTVVIEKPLYCDPIVATF